MSFLDSGSSTHLSIKPSGFLRPKPYLVKKYLFSFHLNSLLLWPSKWSGHVRLRRKNMMSVYQGCCSNLWNSSDTLCYELLLWKIIPKAFSFPWVNIFARPCPLINLVGFISKSYSWIFETHLLLIPRQSYWDMISLRVAWVHTQWFWSNLYKLWNV